jgi:hypothetical protein
MWWALEFRFDIDMRDILGEKDELELPLVADTLYY